MTVAQDQFELLQRQLESGFKILSLPLLGSTGYAFQLRGYEKMGGQPFDYSITVPRSMEADSFVALLANPTENSVKRFLRRDLQKGFVLLDVVGYSLLTIEDQLGLLARLQATIRNGSGARFAAAIEGFIPTGDGCFIAFAQVGFADMLPFTKWLLDAISEYNAAGLSAIPIELRLTAHVGTVDYYRDLHDGWNYIGPGMNETARIMEAKPASGEVFISSALAMHCAGFAARLGAVQIYTDKHKKQHSYQKVIAWP